MIIVMAIAEAPEAEAELEVRVEPAAAYSCRHRLLPSVLSLQVMARGVPGPAAAAGRLPEDVMVERVSTAPVEAPVALAPLAVFAATIAPATVRRPRLLRIRR